MLNMIRMELFRMFKTKSLYVIWTIFAVLMIVTTALTAGEMDAYSLEDRQQNYEYAMEEQESGQGRLRQNRGNRFLFSICFLQI